jgi:hypothetical protein
MNRLGFLNRGICDSNCVLAKEAGMDGQIFVDLWEAIRLALGAFTPNECRRSRI